MSWEQRRRKKLVLPTEILGISSICFCLGPIVRQFSFIFIVLEMSSLSGEDTQNMPTVRSYNLKTHKSGMRGTFQNKTSHQRRQNCFDHTNQTISKLCEEGKGIVQSRVDTIFSPLMSDYNFANLKTGNTWSIDGDGGIQNIYSLYTHLVSSGTLVDYTHSILFPLLNVTQRKVTKNSVKTRQ